MNYQTPFVLTILFIVFHSAYAGDCIAFDPQQSEASSNPVNHLHIGSISINTDEVFDPSKPGQHTFLHRWANKIHIETKDSTVKQQLLFKEGDAFSWQRIHESERLLRANRYIKDATIVPFERCGNSINIKVSTNYKWTLTPGISFGRSGGNNRSGVELQEHNLLGYGKSLSLSYKQETERNSSLLEYLDPQVFGSRKRLFMSLQDNSDGNGYELDFGLPFYALDTRRAWGINSSSFTQDNSVYENGATITQPLCTESA